ncbi:MAG: hypothetical protein ACK557_08720, partial [Planctomycetota bacterium]
MVNGLGGSKNEPDPGDISLLTAIGSVVLLKDELAPRRNAASVTGRVGQWSLARHIGRQPAGARR